MPKKQVIIHENASHHLKPHKNESKEHHNVQTINVQINMPERENAVTGVFKALMGMFRKNG